MSDKKAQQALKDLFIRCIKLNISLFLTQSYFSVPKDVRVHTILFLNEIIRENYKTLLLIIQLMLIIKILLRFTESALKNLIIF